MNTIPDIAQQLWIPVKHFQKDGILSHTYLTELTWLLILKITPHLPVSWDTLIQKERQEQYEYYLDILEEMKLVSDPHIAGIYAYAATSFTKHEQLAQLIAILSTIDTVPLNELGNIFELLLENCANEKDNHLHIAPRSLIDLMIVLTQPQLEEVMQDPVAGIGNVIVAADQYINLMTDDKNIIKKQKNLAREKNLVQQRFALMNCLLHNIKHPQYVPVLWDDSLLLNRQQCPPADVILSVLVFVNTSTDDFGNHDASLALLQQIYYTLKPGGRAAVVLPDNILKAAGPAQQLRSFLLNKCIIHTVLRLPNGIFYPKKIQAHLLFFRKSKTPEEKTQRVWFYDLRTGYPTFGESLQLTRKHLMEFEMLYGDDPLGNSSRNNKEENKRWYRFNRQTLAEQEDRLDLCVQDEKATKNFEYQEKIRTVLNDTTIELESVTNLLC